MRTRHLPAILAAAFLPLLTARALPAEFADGFEDGLGAWHCPWPGKNPVLVRDDRAHSGKVSAYSGPPGGLRVGQIEFKSPFTGTIEVWFYDDMAHAKNQMAGVSGGENELLGIACQGGDTYRYRIGHKYFNTPVKRARRWHKFAWTVDGRRAAASIDDKRIAVTDRLGLATTFFIGSFWDASTGWYDDVRVHRLPPSDAPAFVEAEQLFRETGPKGAAVRIENKPGASERALSHWGLPGHKLAWVLKAPAPGKVLLLVKYATANAKAVRGVRTGAAESAFTFAGTGGWDHWGFAAIPMETNGAAMVVTMENRSGSLNLDWLAFAPPELLDPVAYAGKLNQLVRGRRWLRTAWQQTARAAMSAGVKTETADDLNDLDFNALPSEKRLDELLALGRTQLIRLREQTLNALAPQLDDRYSVAPVMLSGKETPLAQVCYNRLLRYVCLTAPRFHDWPYAADCRYHKREGSAEWDVRQNACVALGYAVLLRGQYDASMTGGVRRRKIASDLTGLLRTLAITHKANFLPTRDGRAWGDQWQSAFWAGIAGQAAWLAWDRLPADVRLMTSRMVEHEADRFNTRPPDSGVNGDTKAEENAWNSEVIALAACMFPRHPHHTLWTERAIVYMINSLVRKDDRASARIVDGKPARERISVVTLHPDFTLENHNRVHPDYLASGSLLLRNALLYRAAGLRTPQSTFFNVPETYAVIKRLTAVNGSCFYVNGQDWWPHRHDVPLLISAACSVLLDDPEAAFLERSTLDFFGRMHARFRDGRAWDPREYNYANAEEEMIARYAELYLLHRLFGDGPKPVTAAEFVRAQSGVRVYEIGGFATHRTSRKFVSFAWVNGAMGLVFPDDDTWFTAPYEHGLVGAIQCRGRKDSRPRVTAHRAVPLGGGMAARVRIARCEGTVEQALAVISFPDAPVVYFEQLRALKTITVDAIGTGSLGILNEDAPGIEDNHRILVSRAGKIDATGATDAPARTLDVHSNWVNIDGRMGVMTSGRWMQYLDTNRYRHSRLREVLRPLVGAGIGDVKQGEVFHAGAVLLVPGEKASETRTERFEFVTDPSGILAARLRDGRVAAANLGVESATATVFGRRLTLAPLECSTGL